MTLNELYKQADYKDRFGMMFNADCLNIMDKMDDESVDLIVTDPPYLMDYVSHRRKEIYKPIQGDTQSGANVNFALSVGMSSNFEKQHGNLLFLFLA